jgi:hypothetical protein
MLYGFNSVSPFIPISGAASHTVSRQSGWPFAVQKLSPARLAPPRPLWPIGYRVPVRVVEALASGP